MDFLFSEEQRIFQKTMRDFCEKEIRPVIAEIDREEKFPYEIYDKLVQMGFPGTIYPEEYGGAGLDFLTLIIGLEEISRISMGMAMAQGWVLYAPPVFYAGNEDQKKKFLAPIISGEKKGCFALTEPNAGSDVAALRCAAKQGAEGFIINGSKIFITNADTSDYMVLAARTGSFEDRHRGISLFVVDCRSEGITINKIPKIGAGAASTCEIVFEDVRVPKDCLVGKEGEGFRIAMLTLDKTRAGIAAIATGVCQRAVDEAAKFANIRHQFGQPIGRFQGISFMLADMGARTAASRQLTRYAAWMADKDMKNSKDSLCQILCSRRCHAECN